MSMNDRYENDINETTFLKSNDDENLTKNPYEDKREQAGDSKNAKAGFLGGLAYKLRNYLGYIFAFLTAINFTIANILVKKAFLLNGADQLTCLFIIKAILMFIVMKVEKVQILGPSGQRVFLSARGLVGVLGLISLYSGLIFLPPSDCSAIANVAIIITAVLARIFLNEKLGFAHMLAIILTIVGVVFISKPSILFPRKPMMVAPATAELKAEGIVGMLNETSAAGPQTGPLASYGAELLNDSLSNQTAVASASPVGMFNMNPQTIFLVGIVLALLAALFFGILQIMMKKLCNVNVHWSVSTIYAAYVGLPMTIALQLLLYFAGIAHQNLSKELPLLPMQIVFSSISGVFAVLGQVCLNIALNYEDPAKVSIAKTTDVFFSFILQYIFLSIQVDIFSILGSAAILLGSCIVLAMKLVEKKLESSKPNDKQNFGVSCLLKKF